MTHGSPLAASPPAVPAPTSPPRLRRPRPVLTVALALGLVAALWVPQTPAPPAAAATSEHVSNGGFDDGRSGWRVSPRSRSALRQTATGRGGSGAVVVRVARFGRVTLHDRGRTVVRARRGAPYRLAAWVRPSRSMRVELAVRETNRRRTRVVRRDFRVRGGTWQRLRLPVVSKLPGSSLDLRVNVRRARQGSRLVVDDVSLTPRRSRAGCVATPRGVPRRGTLVGATVSGSSDLDTRERQLGQTLPVHRTYYGPDEVGEALRTVRRDLARNRLPWISFKLPRSWRQMTAGRGDAWTRDLTRRLARVDGPVWLAFHHEPEHDGPIGRWVQMQRHLSPIVKRHSDNVAYTIILTGWNMFFDEPRHRLPRVWPGDKYVDLLGMDMYNDYGAVRHGREGTTMLEPMRYYRPLSRFARRHDVPWAVAEVGYSDDAAREYPRWIHEAYRDLVSSGGVAMSYFDSSYNSVADWTLSHPKKLPAFAALVRESRRICR